MDNPIRIHFRYKYTLDGIQKVDILCGVLLSIDYVPIEQDNVQILNILGDDGLFYSEKATDVFTYNRVQDGNFSRRLAHVMSDDVSLYQKLTSSEMERLIEHIITAL